MTATADPGGVLRAFVEALRRPLTYQPHRNAFVVLGFLLALPIPLAGLGIHLSAAGLPLSLEAVLECLRRQPLHGVLAAVPPAAAVAFGAMGTLVDRWRRRSEEMLRRLQGPADTDGLTGLPGHRAFQTAIREEEARARAAGRTPALLLMDVDRFREYNETNGHRSGDLALQQIAARMRLMVRASDVLARVGPDRFAALLGEVELGEAVWTAERLRLEAGSLQEGGLTLSAGVAMMRPEETAAEWIGRAEGYLRAAKELGGNHVWNPEAALRGALAA